MVQVGSYVFSLNQTDQGKHSAKALFTLSFLDYPSMYIYRNVNESMSQCVV